MMMLITMLMMPAVRGLIRMRIIIAIMVLLLFFFRLASQLRHPRRVRASGHPSGTVSHCSTSRPAQLAQNWHHVRRPALHRPTSYFHDAIIKRRVEMQSAPPPPSRSLSLCFSNSPGTLPLLPGELSSLASTLLQTRRQSLRPWVGDAHLQLNLS